jgi:hypothetical protein
VVDVPVDVTVELLVESVTIGSAYAVPATPSVITVSSSNVMVFRNILSPFWTISFCEAYF